MQSLFHLWSTIGIQHNAFDIHDMYSGLSLLDLLMFFYFAQTNFCEKTSSFCLNANMAMVCDRCILWKLFHPFICSVGQ